MGSDQATHIMPFFWQHGEDEQTLRDYVRVIRDAGCGAFCVESRPHSDFCGPQWWRDMDVILDEAKKLDMRIWILDDSHFPTGYANGALKEKNTHLCRQSLFCRVFNYGGGERAVRLPLEKAAKPPRYPQRLIWKLAQASLGPQRQFDDDQLYSITAFGPRGEIVPLESGMWQKPAGRWQVAVCTLSRNMGAHRNYINMMDKESCRLLIDAVYEKHWQHYNAEFGHTIVGFFSDEPELGNGPLYNKHNVLGTPQDLPWSRSLEETLAQADPDFRAKLPLLWKNDADPDATAQFRETYMEAVTRLVQANFSEQIGGWCRAHGVQYIGHVIEDNNTHTCTGSSLGHYFRGMSGQDMAGIDNIGGQVMPGGEDAKGKGPIAGERDGEFYHYMLAKLAVSAAQLEPRKAGRAMCEIFGNYGWGLTVSEMKYQADHFLVRGINYFVPHAFSPKPFPDEDCPPHFYAGGHNPQYRHIGALFRYMERVASLISGGRVVTRTAILYNAEAEWADAQNSMLPQVPARILYDRQIDFTILPVDYLDRAKDFDVVIVPQAKYVPAQVQALPNAIYINSLPQGFSAGTVVPLDALAAWLADKGLPESTLAPACDRVRILHYDSKEHLFLLTNEGTKDYSGTVTLPVDGPFYGVDAWNDTSHALPQEGRAVHITLEPRKSLVIRQGAGSFPQAVAASDTSVTLDKWQRSLCQSIDYPHFDAPTPVALPDDFSKAHPKFSGFARYDCTFEGLAEHRWILEISSAADGVEVFLNGESMGIQIVPVFRYDLTGYVRSGKNELRIEVATTAARAAMQIIKNPIMRMVMPIRPGPGGLTGNVTLWEESKP